MKETLRFKGTRSFSLMKKWKMRTKQTWQGNKNFFIKEMNALKKKRKKNPHCIIFQACFSCRKEQKKGSCFLPPQFTTCNQTGWRSKIWNLLFFIGNIFHAFNVTFVYLSFFRFLNFLMLIGKSFLKERTQRLEMWRRRGSKEILLKSKLLRLLPFFLIMPKEGGKKWG